jgi:ankyrin repeat protein
MRLLLFVGADVNGRHSQVDIPIVNASSKGQTEAVRLLLDHGADPNVPEKVHFTALMAAAYGGHLETVRLLLARGATVDEVGDSGSALDIAVAKGDVEMIRLLREAKAPS